MNSENNKKEYLKIGVIGNVDSGKSTLVGVLTKGLKDDGRGEARSRVFNFAHEQSNGRTSSIAQEIMGFNEAGEQILPSHLSSNRNKQQQQVMKDSTKIVTFLDLCGHEKYLKTTMYGLVSLAPDYALLAIGSNMGVARMTREHLGLTLALKIPFIITLTKVDLSPPQIIEQTLQTVVKTLRHPQVGKTPVVVKGMEDLQKISSLSGVQKARITPIFMISSVSGLGIDLLTHYLSVMGTDSQEANDQKPFEFNLTDNFSVTGVGIVVTGIVRAGTATLNQTVMLGPDRNQQFRPVVIKGIHINCTGVESASSGQLCCLLIKSKNKDKLCRKAFRKGMCMLESSQVANTWSFQARVMVLHHSSTIKTGYQCMMHSRVIRQSVRIEGIHQEEELMRTGDTCLVECRFIYNSEYLKEGDTVIFREGRTKLQGKVVRLDSSL